MSSPGEVVRNSHPKVDDRGGLRDDGTIDFEAKWCSSTFPGDNEKLSFLSIDCESEVLYPVGYGVDIMLKVSCVTITLEGFIKQDVISIQLEFRRVREGD